MIRDTQSNALIETDTTELAKYRSDKKKKRELGALKRDVEELKKTVANINNILQKMTEE